MIQTKNLGFSALAYVSPDSVTLLALFFLVAKVNRCPRLLKTVLLDDRPKVTIKTPFHTQKEKDLENKNYTADHHLAYLLCLFIVYLTH